MACRSRPEGSRPFYLYIDECARFVNEDIARILDEARKFGLHLILAHQHLGQLKKAGEDIYHSIMTDAKTKVIFGGLSAQDTRILAEQIFLGELDLEEPKHVLDKPTVIRYIETWLENYSQGKTNTVTTSTTKTEQYGSSSGSSRTQTMTPEEGILWDSEELSSTAYGSNEGESFSWGESEGESFSEGESESFGRSQSLKPVLANLPSSVYSLDEQFHKAMSTMVNQPTQYAIIKLPKKETRFVKTPTIHSEFALPEDISDFKANCYKTAEFAQEKSQAEQLIRKRMEALEKAAYDFQQAEAITYSKEVSQPRVPEKIEVKYAKKDPESFRE